jgi:NAD(P)-dependent dehydrogenase (short-subunit alcohol dehydrogenase family)
MTKEYENYIAPENVPKTASKTQVHTHPAIGHEAELQPKPVVETDYYGKVYKASGKLEGKAALITGGDSGIGRSVAILFAKEGANVAISFHPSEKEDADEAKSLIEKEGRKVFLISEDFEYGEEACKRVIDEAVRRLGGLDILINNASKQLFCDDITQLSYDQLESTFKVNIFAMILLAKYAVPHMKEGSTIINSTSVVAYQGHPSLIDYASTKGAITAFTRSLAVQLAKKGIRVNAVAPGPIYTPLQAASRSEEAMAKFVTRVTTLGRVGQSYDCAPAYVFLASTDSQFFTGQCLHPNGGDMRTT